ncbi:MAG: pyrimidine 5'-nucleotidase [Rubrivivax sp.]|jgi:putative hydrolase of the HAD superfamily|nr:pyrimidine 5'-nucleotidase [Rubrivivax sp.]
MAERPSAPRRVWLFDLDNTLHDASHAVFGPLKQSMTAYIERELGVSNEEAHRLRVRYWQRYGATLLGLMRHHGVSAPHFLHDTHRLPGLEQRLRAPLADRLALARLPGKRVLLTNAPREYALRVLRALRLLRHLDAVIAIEDMVMFGHLRPKPDKRMFRSLVARLRVAPHHCVLVEDTLEHQKAARAVGLKTVWMQGYALSAAAPAEPIRVRLRRKPVYVGQRVRQLRHMRR